MSDLLLSVITRYQHRATFQIRGPLCVRTQRRRFRIRISEVSKPASETIDRIECYQETGVERQANKYQDVNRFWELLFLAHNSRDHRQMVTSAEVHHECGEARLSLPSRLQTPTKAK